MSNQYQKMIKNWPFPAEGQIKKKPTEHDRAKVEHKQEKKDEQQRKQDVINNAEDAPF